MGDAPTVFRPLSKHPCYLKMEPTLQPGRTAIVTAHNINLDNGASGPAQGQLMASISWLHGYRERCETVSIFTLTKADL